MKHLGSRILPFILLASSSLSSGSASAAGDAAKAETAKQPQVVTRPGARPFPGNSTCSSDSIPCRQAHGQ